MIVRQPPSGIRVSMSASEGSDEGPHNVNQLGDELIELGVPKLELKRTNVEQGNARTELTLRLPGISSWSDHQGPTSIEAAPFTVPSAKSEVRHPILHGLL